MSLKPKDSFERKPPPPPPMPPKAVPDSKDQVPPREEGPIAPKPPLTAGRSPSADTSPPVEEQEATPSEQAPVVKRAEFPEVTVDPACEQDTVPIEDDEPGGEVRSKEESPPDPAAEFEPTRRDPQPKPGTVQSRPDSAPARRRSSSDQGAPRPGRARIRPTVSGPLPNATVGKPYSYRLQLDWSPYPAGRIASVEFDGLDDLGLSFDAQTWLIEGVPSKQGEFDLTIRFRVHENGGRLPEQGDRLTLLINPDPRSLWRTLEPDAALPYRKDHTDSRREEAAGVLLLGASRRGRSHAHQGTYRDDDFHFVSNAEDGWFVVIVADGAGSAKFSRKGSDLMCRASTSHLEANFDQYFGAEFDSAVQAYHQDGEGEGNVRTLLYAGLVTSAHAGFKAVLAESRQKQADLKDYATTVVLTLAKRYEFGWLVACFAIGDGGAALILNGRDGAVVLNEPEGGEFSGQTRFVTMREVWQDATALSKRIRFYLVPEFEALVAMTDGVSDPFFRTEREFMSSEAWLPVWAAILEHVDTSKNNLEAGEELLNWLNFWVEGEHDDRTIAMLLPE